MVKIPFSFLPPKFLDKISGSFRGVASSLEKIFPFMQVELDQANMKVETKKYFALCLTATTILFSFMAVFLTLILFSRGNYFLGVIISFVFSGLIFFVQLNYPKSIANKRIKQLDADLLEALRAVTIQLNSGVPLFEAMTIISKQNFGEVSSEFGKAVKRINAGVPQAEALEQIALQNPSQYFRRALWQIINGMKEGATINEVLKTVIENLSKEQIIQIEQYGSRLSPLAMFYMMGAVILPALGMTFILVITSFIGLDEMTIKIIFIGLLVFVVFFQFMFSGIVKTKRPSLLGE
ncbi:MAG: type II secretion system F family protein [Nanoarchaeota archaeon]|nr:type II secretion system F family protein [Nanoarchaeota archaeon]MBU1644653.1 type II secretion system F family protein [Nanoarchaeota archaeon]MBU1977383.1 type II secretion system F family protein [Nanoarchaeota archaeon]